MENRQTKKSYEINLSIQLSSDMINVVKISRKGWDAIPTTYKTVKHSNDE